MSEHAKITAGHRQRRAVVYVRQSTPGQVERNTESSARQYALAERAVELGWPPESVVVVDEDTGRSAAWARSRIGFRELVAEVGLGHVGVILALEVSRLARSSADWHQLLDLCALTATLICDGDGIYSPGEFNDRLLLGLKGTMSEAELHLIRSRLRGGIENKARRGELRLNLPIGLDRDRDGQIQLTADEQVRAAIERVYALWRRCALRAPGRLRARRSESTSCLPPADRRRAARALGAGHFGAVHDLLTNPVYAGAFVYGRTRERKTVDADGRDPQPHGAAARPVARLPARPPPRLRQLEGIPRHPGPAAGQRRGARRGRRRRPRRQRAAPGLVRCGRCGRRMMVAYSGTGGRAGRYLCSRTFQPAGHAPAVPGARALDRAVAAAFLDAVTPAGVDAARRARSRELQPAHDERVAAQRLAVERAAYEAERARRQYDACEPENRLVARTLEDAPRSCARRTRAPATGARRARATPARAALAIRADALRRLAGELPRLWDAPSTTARDRKELLRALIEEAVVTVREDHGVPVWRSSGRAVPARS